MVMFFLFNCSAFAQIIEDIEFMNGYQYEYKDENCSVEWSVLDKKLILLGRGCDNLPMEKIYNDVAISVDYVKRQGEFLDFAHYYLSLESAKDGVYQSSAPREILEESNHKNKYTNNMAVRDAQFIWLAGCNDYKKGMSLGDFSRTNNLGKMMQIYNGIKERVVISLYSDGWDIAKFKKGFVNCAGVAPYRVNDFISGMDVRR